MYVYLDNVMGFVLQQTPTRTSQVQWDRVPLDLPVYPAVVLVGIALLTGLVWLVSGARWKVNHRSTIGFPVAAVVIQLLALVSIRGLPESVTGLTWPIFTGAVLAGTAVLIGGAIKQRNRQYGLIGLAIAVTAGVITVVLFGRPIAFHVGYFVLSYVVFGLPLGYVSASSSG
jgi:hypothetical protein